MPVNKSILGAAFVEWVSTRKNTWQNYSGKDLLVVLGNESCDMDSVISALLLGFFKENKDGSICIPMLNTSIEEFEFRFDVMSQLELLGISAEWLLFTKTDKKSQITFVRDTDKVILVDHNRITCEIDKPEERIVAIYDHHPDEKAHPQAHRHIEHTTSALSLILAEYKELWSKPGVIDETFARFCVGPLLLDSSNFSQVMQSKWTPNDVEIVKELERCSGQTFGDTEYKRLFGSRTNLSRNIHLGLEKLCSKDYKNYEFNNYSIGVGDLFMTFGHIKKCFPNYGDELRRISKERKKNMMALTCFHRDNDGESLHFILCSTTEDHEAHHVQCTHMSPTQLVQILKQQILKDEKFRAEEEVCDYPFVHVFNLKNLSLTRKTIMPMIESMIFKQNRKGCSPQRSIVLFGTFGVGKSIVAHLLSIRNPKIKNVRLVTTRPPRPVTESYDSMRYISEEEFQALIKDDALIEFNIVNGHMYGTLRSDLEDGHGIFIGGLSNIGKYNDSFLKVLLQPPSKEVLEKRCKSHRTMDINYEEEMAYGNNCIGEFDLVICNDDLSKTIETIEQAMSSTKRKLE